MRGFFGIRLRAVLIVALALGFLAQTGAPLAQAAKTEKPVEQKTVPAKVEKLKADDGVRAATLSSKPKPAIPLAIEAEIQSRLNEVRKEVLDYRADNIGWWLAFIAIVFTVLGVVLAAVGLVGGYIGFNIFRDLRSDAQKSVDATNQHLEDAKRNHEEAKGLVEEIKRYRDETKAIRDETAESAADDPERVRQVAEDTRNNPQASPMDKAIADAISLQQERKFEEAIEAWRKIANVMEGIDDDLAARAWFSIGYLYSVQEQHEEAIDAYSRSIDLQPNDVVSYNNRGVTRGKLHQYEAAIADFDEALRIDPYYSSAYMNRGIAKKNLDQHEAAIKDYSKAISLKSDYAGAYYNRGITHLTLGNKEAARRDLEKTHMLARETGDDDIAASAKRQLQKFDEE